MIAIHPEQLRNLITGAAIVAAKTTAQIMGGCADVMLMKNAKAKYGHGNVKKWHKSGYLHPKRGDDGCIYFPVVELMIASKTDEIQRLLTPNASEEIRSFFDMQSREV